MSSWRDRFHVVPAVYVVVERDGKILLIKRANTGYFDGLYSLPAGHLNGNEPATRAAVRELKEETGIIVRPDLLTFAHIMHRRAPDGEHERIDLFFYLREFAQEPTNREPDKCSELIWRPLDDLPDLMVPEIAHVLNCVAKGTMYSEFNFGEPI